MPAKFATEEEMEAAANAPGGIEWSDPEPIPDTLRQVPAMDPAMIPASLRGFVLDIAERLQCPLDFVAVAATVALGSVVGASIGIRPERWGDWTVVPNFWGMLIGRPSTYKSPAMGEAIKPLGRLEAMAKEDHESALRNHEFEAMAAKARADELRDRLKKATKQGGNIEALRLEFQESEPPDEPTRRRFMVNDPTVEALGILLNRNPRGVLVFRDELFGWLQSLDKMGHENDRAFYLEAFNGLGRYTYDRVGRGTLDIERACVSILGGIQPSRLLGYLDAAVSGGYGDDGLIQRFQLMVYPDQPDSWRKVDRAPDADAKNRAFGIFNALANLEPLSIATDGGEGEIPFLRFDDQAQALFDSWQFDLMNRVRKLDSAAMEAHLGKYPRLLPALALVFHLVDLMAGEATEARVSYKAAVMAATWCEYLEAHAWRVYATTWESGYARARALAAHIQAGGLESPFAAREVHRKGWSLLTDLEHVREALEALEELGWVRGERRQQGGRGGRPSVEYHVNPKVERKGGEA